MGRKLTSVDLKATVARHSAFSVGLLSAKITGRLLIVAMELRISLVKEPGTAAVPKR